MNTLSIHHLNVGYSNKTDLLTDVNAEIPASTLTALIGRNGSGKSSLLRVIAGIDKARSGSIGICGKDASALSAIERAKLVAYVSSRRISIADTTCRAAVAMGRAPYTGWYGSLSASDWKIVDDSLSLVGMTSFAHRMIDTLSDGEFQRIMIARALAQDTPIIILDEPTSFLDIPGRVQLCRLLADLAHNQGKTILFSTHELDIALATCDLIALIDNKTSNVGTLLIDRADSPALRQRINLAFEL